MCANLLVRSERKLQPLQNRGLLVSFAGAKVRRLFHSCKRFCENFIRTCKKKFFTPLPSRAFLYIIILERPLHRNRRNDKEAVIDAFIGPYEILGDLHLCADAPFGIVVDAGQVPEVHP